MNLQSMSQTNESGITNAIVATYAARIWSMVMGLAFIPVYMKLLGPEGFGLVGVFLTIQAVMSLLDAGISTTLNRDFARLSGSSGKGFEYRELLSTLEVGIWSAAALACGLVMAFGSTLAVRWLNFESLSVTTLKNSICIMGAILFFQLPIAFYGGGLLGLQRPVLFSCLNAFWYTVRFAGSALSLQWIAATPECFFTWQLAATALCVVLNAAILRSCLPAPDRPVRFRWHLLSDRWRFAAGLSGISVSALILNQADKLILCKIIPLKEFGYYVLAWSAANGLRSLADPIFTIYFPRLSQAMVNGDTQKVSQTYHQGCQLMTILIAPIGVTIVVFAREILQAWTHDPLTVEHSHALLSLLSLGNIFLAMMILPYALQLASGWTSLTFLTNIAISLLLIPLLIVLAPKGGAIAASYLWVALNATYLFVGSRLMHSRLLRGELWCWYTADIGGSALAAVLILASARLFFSGVGGALVDYRVILAALIGAQVTAAMASPLWRSLNPLKILPRQYSNYRRTRSLDRST